MKLYTIYSPSHKTMYKHYFLFNLWTEPKIYFYKPVPSLGEYGPHTSWYDSFDRMCEDISKIDFDVALLACGGYGMPLCGFIKNNLSKGAIYVGGCLQLFFGIKGRRWDTAASVTNHYNKYRVLQCCYTKFI